jgi:sulfonate transport system ATP-binding protein
MSTQLKVVQPVSPSQPLSGRGTALHIHGLKKSFGDREVLHGLDLDIQSGEFVALVGRSGCGKSTLLRLIAGLDKPTSGEIRFDDAVQNGVNPDVRVMFQDSRLLPWQRVLANVAIGLPRDRLAGAQEVLAQVGLEDRRSDWPAQLSGGQRQRVALARALVHHPLLLLLDEPLGALDALTRIGMQDLIERLWTAGGFTALLVTHDVQEAIALADRIILIDEGRIALDRRVTLPRPRVRGSVAFAALEESILRHVLQQPPTEPETPFGDLSLTTTVAQVHWAI